MPASASHINQRNSSPKSEASYRGHNTAVAGTGNGRPGRKKGKDAIQKETVAATETESNLAGDFGRCPSPAQVGNSSKAAVRPLSPNDFTESAVLDALNTSEKALDPDASILASAWAQSIAPPKSPSTDPLEDLGSARSPARVAQNRERADYSSNRTPPSSPLVRKSRPASFSPGTLPAHPRRLISERTTGLPAQPFTTSSPPPPHLPQPHFFGVPDVVLGPGNRLSEGRFDAVEPFISFAKLPPASLKRPKNQRDAVLLAYEGRLDVTALEKDKLGALGALVGLRGTVVDAKILTWGTGSDPFRQIRPLISLIIHGPKRQDQDSNVPSGPAGMKSQTFISTNTAGHLSTAVEGIIDFQTTVEVYSLANQEHITTLLSSQLVSTLPNIRGLSVSAPSAVGSLKLDACGNYLTVSSGTSGEVFVFTADHKSTAKFRCVGKLWTSIQSPQERRYSNSSNSTDPDASPADINRGTGLSHVPIMSLSSRWLAIVPPGPLSPPALPVTFEQSSTSAFGPGLETRNAPARPAVSCTLESPDAQSLLNRVARGVAQEMVRGARWLGDQGVQTWNSYWKAEQNTNTQSPGQHRNLYSGDAHTLTGAFPPTHAPEARPSLSEPALVSIIDLHTLAAKSHVSAPDVAMPVATFQPPNGVSFLSFSPDGLFITTATQKGDIQYVWDLKQVSHLRAGPLLTSSDSETLIKSGKVTQVARFARLTPSSIVNIEWECPSGGRLAVITKNGTIHVFDLPLAALQWPPIRRAVRQEPTSAPASPAISAQPDEPTVVGGLFSTAMKLAGKTQPMLANLRGRAPSIGMSNIVGTGNNPVGFASATGIRGGKAVAAGLSRSVGAATGTVKSLRHAGDNRLHLSSLGRHPARARVGWSRDREQPALLVMDGELIKSFPVSRRRSASKPRRQALTIIDSNPGLNVPLPDLEQLASLDVRCKPGLQQIGETPNTTGGYWIPHHPPSRNAQPPPRIGHPLSYAEIESNAPFQPFHSDRRVHLSVYHDKFTEADGIESPWVFGEDIPVQRLDIHPRALSDDDNEEEEDHRLGASSLYRHNSTITTSGGNRIDGGRSPADQIVVTTRRRKARTTLLHQSVGVGVGVVAAGAGAAAAAAVMGRGGEDDGFFEDDCDVLDFADDRV